LAARRQDARHDDLSALFPTPPPVPASAAVIVDVIAEGVFLRALARESSNGHGAARDGAAVFPVLFLDDGPGGEVVAVPPARIVVLHRHCGGGGEISSPSLVPIAVIGRPDSRIQRAPAQLPASAASERYLPVSADDVRSGVVVEVGAVVFFESAPLRSAATDYQRGNGEDEHDSDRDARDGRGGHASALRLLRPDADGELLSSSSSGLVRPAGAVDECAAVAAPIIGSGYPHLAVRIGVPHRAVEPSRRDRRRHGRLERVLHVVRTSVVVGRYQDGRVGRDSVADAAAVVSGGAVRRGHVLNRRGILVAVRYRQASAKPPPASAPARPCSVGVVIVEGENRSAFAAATG